MRIPENYINKSIKIVEQLFREHNQLTTIYCNDLLITRFGTNEGGPSYKIFVNEKGIVLDIQEFNMNV